MTGRRLLLRQPESGLQGSEVSWQFLIEPVQQEKDLFIKQQKVDSAATSRKNAHSSEHEDSKDIRPKKFDSGFLNNSSTLT